MRKRIWIPDYSTAEKLVGKKNLVKLPSIGLAGFFELELVDAKTGKVKEFYRWPNVITLHYLDGAGTGSIAGTIRDGLHDPVFGVMYIGSGSLPTELDIQIEGQIGSSSQDDGGFGTTSGFVTGSGWPRPKSGSYWYHRMTRVFLENAHSGTVGLISLSKSNDEYPNLGNIHGVISQIRDATGSAITIDKTTEDQLRITHEMRLYPPTDELSTSGTIEVEYSDGGFGSPAATHSWTASALRINNGSTWGPEVESPGSFDNVGHFCGFGDWNWTMIFALQATHSNGTILFGTVNEYGMYDVTASLAAGTWYQSFNEVSSKVIEPYISASYQDRVTATWEPEQAAFWPTGSGAAATGHEGGIRGFALHPLRHVTFPTNDGSFQIRIDPPLRKDDLDRLVIPFSLTWYKVEVPY